jgi:predicted transcriptional regulator
MQRLDPQHNANLHQTLPEQASIVNPVDNLEVSSALLDVSLAVTTSDKLFVKIPNAIYNYLLKPRLLEFYCLLSYLVFNYPSSELPIRTIQSLILKHRGYKMSKNTINKYLNNLINLGLISRNHKFYVITDLRGNAVIPLLQVGFNVITLPKDNYTPFYITPYSKQPISGSLALELYLASKPYDRHRPSKVCRDLNISRKTYYNYLKDIISKSIVKRIRLSYNNYHYTHDYRLVLWAESCNRMKSNYEKNKTEWQKTKPKNSVNISRRWYASSMARVMKQYGINYIKAFDCYNPEDAYAIVVELEKQYESYYKPLNASIIVKGIMKAYNWTKIVDKRHQVVKANMFKVQNNVFDRMFKVDYN